MAKAEMILFLDDDHVLRMMRGVLDGDREAVASFLAPEQVPWQRIDAMATGLRRGDGVVTRSVSEAAGLVSAATVFVLRRAPVTTSMLSPRLRLVQRLGERSDSIDLAAAARAGVPVSCLPRRTLAHTAEHTMLLMLAVAKRLLAADRAVRGGALAPGPPSAVAYNWSGIRELGGLQGRTLGVVGLGEVGSMVARQARAFGMRVLYTQRHRLTREREAALGVEHRELHPLLAESEFVSLHVPGSHARAPLLGPAEFAAMRQGAIFVNTSRGALVDERALCDALTDGQLAGAGLDVHAAEPRPANDPLCQLDTVVLTPHIAGGSRLAVLDEIEAMLDNIRAAFAGRAPLHGRVGHGA